MNDMDLQSLFSAPIVEQTYLDPGYSGHASDVWRVQTTQEVVVVRALRETQELEGPFWKGCHALFGLDPKRLFDLEPINATLARLCPIPIPQVLRKGMLEGQPYVVVEYMPGSPLHDFTALPESALEALGQALAQIHTRRFGYYGSASWQSCSTLSTFPARLTQTMRMLVHQFYQADAAIKEALPSACEAVAQLPPLEEGALILIDIDPTQFLTDGEHFTALVDTEAYAIGPRELDFIGLEYVLDQRGATAVARGYNGILPFPELSQVRSVYRYLYRLLEVQGSADLEVWMRHPPLFDSFVAD
jgi:fructosamine-3-kinase